MIRNFFLFTGLDILFFWGLIFTSMTDERPSVLADGIYWVLKFILGFPLVLINEKYPFFIDSPKFGLFALSLVIFNNIILSLFFYKLIKWVRSGNGID